MSPSRSPKCGPDQQGDFGLRLPILNSEISFTTQIFEALNKTLIQSETLYGKYLGKGQVQFQQMIPTS